MAAQLAELNKRVSLHTLGVALQRFLEQDIDIRVIQVLLGQREAQHNGPELYTRVATSTIPAR